METSQLGDQPGMASSGKHLAFKQGFTQFLGEHMLFNDSSGSILDLVKSMVFKSPQPRSMFEFMLSAQDLVEEDVKRYAK
jgi:hypothetical protein